MTKGLVAHGAALLLAVATMSAMGNVHAKQTMCVFDLLGTSGEMFALMRDYALAARNWGVDLQLRAYTNERVAAEDFKAGQCDAVFLTGIRGRQFNHFTGSIDAFGAVPSNANARSVLKLMASPQLAKDMVQDNYEIAGVLSFGSAYTMLRDRTFDTLTKMAGKKIAVLEHDQSQVLMAQRYGFQPVLAEVHTFGGMFNNGQVDIIGAPAMAFRAMELYRGIGQKGGVGRFPLLHVSTNIVINHSKFPEGYGQKSRTWVATQVPRVMDWVERMEKDIPEKSWINVSANDHVGYARLMRESRIDLTKRGFYHPKMMKLLKRVRCVQNPNSFECSLREE